METYVIHWYVVSEDDFYTGEPVIFTKEDLIEAASEAEAMAEAMARHPNNRIDPVVKTLKQIERETEAYEAEFARRKLERQRKRKK